MALKFARTLISFCGYLLLVGFKSLDQVAADEHIHSYEKFEPLYLWLNTVGPYSNRQETYAYYALPFCRGTYLNVDHEHSTFGEKLLGMQLVNSGFRFLFLQDTVKDIQEFSACKVYLTQEDVVQMKYAISNNYWYSMYIDDMPISGKIGVYKKDEGRILLHNAFGITVGYNGKRVVTLDMQPVRSVDLAEWREEDNPIEFQYYIKFVQSDYPFKDRMNQFSDLNNQHYTSMVIAFLTVIVLVAIAFYILIKTLKADMVRYFPAATETASKNLGLDRRNSKDRFDLDYGWKLVQGDIFRAPTNLIAFSSFIGTGVHLASTFFFLLLVMNVDYIFDLGYFSRERHGNILSTCIFIYSFSACVSGFYGARLYIQNGGSSWIKQVIIQACFLPIFLLVNVVGSSFLTGKYLGFVVYFKLALALVCSLLPLTFIGAIIGRTVTRNAMSNDEVGGNLPCHVNYTHRRIPKSMGFSTGYTVVFLGGLLPFFSISTETYLIYSAFSNYETYYMYGISLMVFTMLIISACASNILVVYVLLNAEDWRWWWSSFLSGFSVGMYVFIYSIYYYIFKTSMYGIIQMSYYFTFSLVMSVLLGLSTGSCGFMASHIFVNKIYSTIKST